MRLQGWAVALVLLATASGAQIVHAPDADPGSRFSTIEVPAKPGAPFEANVITSWKFRTTTHWNKRTMWNRRRIARDSRGRVFQERRMFSPNGDTKPTTVSELDFYDPSTGQVTIYDPRSRQCTVQPYPMTRGDYAPLPTTQQGPQGVTIARTSLGPGTLQNQPVTGSRESLTFPGMNSPSTVTEFWYSAALGVNLSLKRTEANGDAQTFTVTDLEMREPDPKLFTPPAECAAKH